jgi:hypothetical protein
MDHYLAATVLFGVFMGSALFLSVVLTRKRVKHALWWVVGLSVVATVAGLQGHGWIYSKINGLPFVNKGDLPSMISINDTFTIRQKFEDSIFDGVSCTLKFQVSCGSQAPVLRAERLDWCENNGINKHWYGRPHGELRRAAQSATLRIPNEPSIGGKNLDCSIKWAVLYPLDVKGGGGIVYDNYVAQKDTHISFHIASNEEQAIYERLENYGIFWLFSFFLYGLVCYGLLKLFAK